MTTRHQGPNHPEVPQIEADAQIGNKEEARSPPNPGVNAVTAAGQFSKKAAIAGWRRPMEQETESDPIRMAALHSPGFRLWLGAHDPGSDVDGLPTAVTVVLSVKIGKTVQTEEKGVFMWT